MGCVFCERVARGEYATTGRDEVVCFEPLNPVVPGHMLFIPCEHVADASEHPYLTGQCFAAAATYYVPRIEGDGLTLPWTGQVKHVR